jgi:drug/metabolite transporter (DMT)-like permease
MDEGRLSLGIATGFAAALLSAVSYLVSRHHAGRPGGDAIRLLVCAHVVMAAVCLPLVWLAGPVAAPAAAWLPALAGSTCCYLAGQAALFAALRLAPASRIAPLLGLKIGILAAIVTCLPGDPLDARQWAAVALGLAAAALLQRGGGIAPSALALVLVTCLAFAVADLCIVGLIDGLQAGPSPSAGPEARLRTGVLAMSLTYVTCGAAAVLLLVVRRTRPRDGRDWRGGGWYAAAWLGSMVALYACFGLLGAVFGNILQSTRGVMAIVIGAVLAHLGWHELEDRVDRFTLLRRVMAAALMTAAIALYATMPPPPATPGQPGPDPRVREVTPG